MTRPLQYTVNLNSFLAGLECLATGLKGKGKGQADPLTELNALIWKLTERKSLPVKFWFEIRGLPTRLMEMGW